MGSERADQILSFLGEAGWQDAARDPIAGDASTRAYERLSRKGAGAILMNAPPSAEGPACPIDATPSERQALGYNALARLAGPDPAAFVCLARELTRRGFSAPRILAANLSQGLILLEDLGDALFADVLSQNPDRERELYEQAVSCLAALYRSSFIPELKHQNASWHVQDYDEIVLQTEADLFLEWYMPHFGADLDAEATVQWRAHWQSAFAHLRAHAPGLALRDFHAENIFILANRDGVANIGLIDFQDALFAHPSYDLVSLLEDARRDVSREMVPSLISRFCQGAGITEDENFHSAYAVQAAQRNAKILGIFVRLAKRDGKQKYLDLLPRVAAHFVRDISHPALSDLKSWIEEYSPSLLELAT